MIDLHSHILPGIDDGVRSLADARLVAREAAETGVRAIAATPHVRDDYPTSADRMEEAVEALRRDFAAEEIPIDVLHGGELALEQLAVLGGDELRRFTLAQNGRYLLVEFPYRGWPLGLEPALAALERAGLTAVVAHPERNRAVQERPSAVEVLVEAGALVQVTAGSIAGLLGGAARAAAEKLLKLGLVHLLASDAHGPELHRGGLAEARSLVGDPHLGAYLTSEAPAAIVAGERLPARPTPRSRWRFGVRPAVQRKSR